MRVQEPSLVSRFFSSRLFLVATTVVLLITSLSFARAYYRNYQVQQEIRELKQEVTALEGKTLESMDILEYVKSDSFVEETARIDQNMKRPGEKVIVIKEVSDVQYGNAARPEVSKRGLFTNPVKWWNYFTKHK